MSQPVHALPRILAVTTVVLALHVTASAVQAQNALHIPFGGTTIGSVQSITLAPHTEAPSRFVLELVARFPSFAADLDRELNRRGNLNTCAQRLHWGGRTSIRATGPHLQLRSRIGFEQWVCDIPIINDNAHIFGDARYIDWRLEINATRLDRLQLTARVTNVAGIPRWVEDTLGLRFVQRFRISLLASCEECRCVQDALDLEAVSTNFSSDGDNVYATATFSAASDITTAVSCFIVTTR